MNDKKAIKKLIKRAKANPDLYNNEDVKYAKLLKKTLKLKKDEQNLTSKEIQGIMEKAIQLDQNKYG